VSECLACGGLTVLEKVDVERWWEGRLVIIEGAPTHVCRQCGERYFDGEIVLAMDRILQAGSVPGERFIQVPVRPFSSGHAPQDRQ